MLEILLFGMFMVLLVRLIDLDKDFWFEHRGFVVCSSISLMPLCCFASTLFRMACFL